jgi:hypothetical protein
MHFIYLIILGLYLTAVCTLGWRVMSTWFLGFPKLLRIVGAFLTGMGVGVPVTYAFSCVFAKTNDPILWGTASAIVLLVIVLSVCRGKAPNSRKIAYLIGDVALGAGTLVFSSWIMMKTFHGSAGGQLFVGSNTIFDSAYLVGLVRSMSWGGNIPFSSPYFAGAPLFYHFFFVFLVALLEHFGIPIVWAVNIPSILSFTSLLILIYYLPQLTGKQKPIVGWIAVLFTVTNSSLAFWQLVWEKGLSLGFILGLWRMPTYPFAGPFDGSVISIFVTLNNYVNQRHLAFAVAAGLFLYMVAVNCISSNKITVKKSAVLGATVGLLFLWNMAIFILAAGLIGFLFVIHKNWKLLVAFLAGTAVLFVISMAPFAPFLYRAAVFVNTSFISNSYGTNRSLPAWNIGAYLWQNLGILPIIAGLGYLVIPRKIRVPFLPFVVLFALLCAFATVGKRGFDQKAFSFLIPGINALAAGAVYWLWMRRRSLAKAGAIIVIAVLTVSGFVDLMPIKNEFAYPLIDSQTAPVIAWIRATTAKNAIFVSYSDMIDPVVIGGRTNYFGFYGNIGWYDRSPVVRQVYRGDTKTAEANNISYILIPKWKKTDFPYVVDERTLRDVYPIVYEDNRVVIFGTGI